MIHFTYITINNLNKKCYIGKHSTDNLEDGYIGSGYNLNRAIKKYGKKNFTCDIIRFYPTDEEAYQAEIELLEPLWNWEMCYNITNGGEGVGSGESNYMYGKIGKDCPNYGKIRSKETRKKLSEAAKEQHRLHPKPKKPKQLKIKFKFKPNLRIFSVYQYDLKGNYITSYKSITEAHTASGVGISHIARCRKGKKPAAGGYQWSSERVDKMGNFTPLYSKLCKSVLQYSVAGILIAEFESTNAASRATGIGTTSLWKCLHGERKTSGGFIWIFTKQENKTMKNTYCPEVGIFN